MILVRIRVGPLGTGGMGVPSRDWSHLGVSVQVGLQQLLCLLDVDIPSTWRWQGGTLLGLLLLGPALPLATCQSLLGTSVFLLWDGTMIPPISRVIGGLDKLMWTLPGHITGSIIWKPFLSLHPGGTASSYFPQGGAITPISQMEPTQRGSGCSAGQMQAADLAPVLRA